MMSLPITMKVMMKIKDFSDLYSDGKDVCDAQSVTSTNLMLISRQTSTV